MNLSAGDRLGRYEILDPLGAGGMGEVYRARDTELDRAVAIKVLPGAVADDKARIERFRREAKAVAKLAHPNILEIWDFGTEGGITFAVTELLEGQTLRERVPASGLPWQKVVEMGAAIADGLAAAHAKGIIHRDLKPENVYVTEDGRIKILDFGLAAIREEVPTEAETGTLTPAGTMPATVIGTLGYMSPEQLRGKPADSRSDIFALGCVLYEMVSGKRAFAGTTTADFTAAVLKEEPRRLSSTDANLPVELENSIHRCLEKSPDARFQSASDLAYNLRAVVTGAALATATPTGEIRPARGRRMRWLAAAAAVVASALIGGFIWQQRGEEGVAPAAPQVDPNRVAVVPLVNRTGDPALDELGTLAADLIAQRFAETAAAEVVPLTEALGEISHSRTDGQQMSAWSHVLEFARSRDAGVVLGGAYYLDGSALRLQARLVDAANGDLIHAFEPVSAAREGVATGIDTLRERVVAAVAAHGNPMIDISVLTPPLTYEAYRAFQQGLELHGIDWAEAIAHYRRALERDPDFPFARIALGWALLATCEFQEEDRQLLVLEQRLGDMTRFEEFAVRYQRAVLEWDRVTSLKLVRRLREFAPKLPWAGQDFPFRALELNRPRDAIVFLHEYRGYQKPDDTPWPSHFPHTHMTSARHMLGDFRGELESANRGFEQFPGIAHFYFAKARALAARGQIEEVNRVIEEFQRVQTRGGSPGALTSATAMELRAHGYRAEADEMAARSVQWFEAHPPTGAEMDQALAVESRALGHPGELRSYAQALCMVGRWGGAEDIINRMIETECVEFQLSGWLGMIAAIRGDDSAARQISASLIVEGSPRVSGWGSYWQASIAAHLGEEDRAIELLTGAFSKGFPYGVYLHSALEFEPLWDHPAFQELIEPKG